MLGGAVDVDLVEHVEGDVVLLDELLDLGIAARLLMGFKSTSWICYLLIYHFSSF